MEKSKYDVKRLHAIARYLKIDFEIIQKEFENFPASLIIEICDSNVQENGILSRAKNVINNIGLNRESLIELYSHIDTLNNQKRS